jgi:rhodanese-related sulfurtransferase
MRPGELPALSAREASDRLATSGALLVDVREMDEFVASRVEGSVLMPVSEFGLRFRELPKDRPLLMFCQSGNRSAMATDFLLRQGFSDVHNVVGGIRAWRGAGLAVRSGPLAAGEGSLEAAVDDTPPPLPARGS